MMAKPIRALELSKDSVFNKIYYLIILLLNFLTHRPRNETLRLREATTENTANLDIFHKNAFF